MGKNKNQKSAVCWKKQGRVLKGLCLVLVFVLPTLVSAVSVHAASTLSIKRYIFWGVDYSLQDFATYTDGMQLHYDAQNVLSIRTARSDYVLFLYRNVRDVHSAGDYVYNNPSMLELDYFRSQGWLLHDSAGSELTDPTTGNRPCDIGNPNYQQYIANWIYYYVQLKGYTGTFLDGGMCPTASSWVYGFSGAPAINPRTGLAWTNLDVQNAYVALYAVIKTKLGNNFLVIANSVCVSTGYKYFNFGNYHSPTIQMSQQIDGFMSEEWLSGSDAGAYYPESFSGPNYDWKDSVDMLVDFENQLSGKNIVLYAGEPSDNPSYGLATDAQKQQYCTFVYASMLLGMGTKNTYWLGLGYWGWRNMQSLYALNIGTPSGSYMQDGNGNYVRQFANGNVTVNPSTSTRGTLTSHSALITITSNPSPPPYPALSQYTLTVPLTGGEGFIYIEAQGIPSTYSPATPSLPAGTVVKLTAYDNPGWQFSGWQIDGAAAGTSNPTYVTMNANHTVQALYVAAAGKYTLTINLTGGKGCIYASGPGIGTYSPATLSIPLGTVVTLTAYNNSGFKFSYWKVDDVSVGSANPLTLTMNGPHNVYAMYTP